MEILKLRFNFFEHIKSMHCVNIALEFLTNWMYVSLKYFWIAFVFLFFIVLCIFFVISLAMIFTPQISFSIKAGLLVFMFLSVTLVITVFKYYF